jgi:hypothetical protein
VTTFLNLDGVRLAALPRRIRAEDREDIVPRVELGRPGLTQGFIFAENAKTLTW